MEITDLERDALRELANIGLSRAATQLSALLKDRIEMTVPSVEVVNPDQVANVLKLDSQASVTAVWQHLAGHFEGTAILIFPSEGSRSLVHSLLDPAMQDSSEFDFHAIEHEAMTEIGNIIISSGMVAIADMLGQEIVMSMPDYVEAKLSDVMEQRGRDKEGEQMQVIIMFTRLYAAEREIEGRMVLLMTVRSVRALFARLFGLLQDLQGGVQPDV